jgi:hypothetical protein
MSHIKLFIIFTVVIFILSSCSNDQVSLILDCENSSNNLSKAYCYYQYALDNNASIYCDFADIYSKECHKKLTYDTHYCVINSDYYEIENSTVKVGYDVKLVTNYTGIKLIVFFCYGLEDSRSQWSAITEFTKETNEYSYHTYCNYPLSLEEPLAPGFYVGINTTIICQTYFEFP